MYDGVECHQNFNHLTDEVSPLVTYELNRTAILAPYVLLQKLCCGCRGIVSDLLCLHPLHAIVYRYDNISQVSGTQ